MQPAAWQTKGREALCLSPCTREVQSSLPPGAQLIDMLLPASASFPPSPLPSGPGSQLLRMWGADPKSLLLLGSGATDALGHTLLHRTDVGAVADAAMSLAPAVSMPDGIGGSGSGGGVGGGPMPKFSMQVAACQLEPPAPGAEQLARVRLSVPPYNSIFQGSGIGHGRPTIKLQLYSSLHSTSSLISLCVLPDLLHCPVCRCCVRRVPDTS